jgi:Rod binding domain-containing protein
LSGDDSALKAALKSLGISDEGIKQLERDMTVEKEAIGPKVKKWMAEAGKYLSKEGAKAGVDVARKLATRWILQRYGIDLG